MFHDAPTSCPLHLSAVLFAQALKERNIKYLVAPYEADAQMAFLARSGAVHAVITEDSDLVAYACPRCRTSVELTCSKHSTWLPNTWHGTAHLVGLPPWNAYGMCGVFKGLTQNAPWHMSLCRILFKLDHTGVGEQILLADLPVNRGMSLAGFSHDMFLQVSRSIAGKHEFMLACYFSAPP